jgi:hypothetical protein
MSFAFSQASIDEINHPLAPDLTNPICQGDNLINFGVEGA